MIIKINLTLLLGLTNLLAISQKIEPTTLVRDVVEIKEQKVPIFSVTSLSGAHWNNDSIDGKVTLFSFWYIGCMPCMNEISYFNKLYAETKNEKDFVMLSFAPQVTEDLKAFNDTTKSILSSLRRMFQADPIKYEIIPTCQYRKPRIDTTSFIVTPECDNVVKEFNVKSYPTIFIIDKKGSIRFRHEGFPSDSLHKELIMKDYMNEIKKLLKE